MEESFDLSKFLRNHTKKHKSKPAQFGSVAGGVQKRLETNLKHRRSSRLTLLDNIRNIQCDSPVPLTIAQLKVEHRRQQLEKWKEQKQKQKMEAATQKKKPFLIGVPRVPQKYVPPPPITIPKPSTFGRVTRSQSSKNNIKLKETNDYNYNYTQSFAPKNASFQPPKIKNADKLPNLATAPKKSKQHSNITFNPILPNILKDIEQTKSKISAISLTETNKHTRSNTSKTSLIETNKQTRSKTSTTSLIETNKQTRSKTSTTNLSDTNKQVKSKTSTTSVGNKPVVKQSERTKTKVLKQVPKKGKVVKAPLQGSSSEMEVDTCVSPITIDNNVNMQSARKPRKSLQNRLQTPEKPVPRSESSSEERLRSPKEVESVPLTPEQIVEEAMKFSPFVTKSRGKDNARKEMRKKIDEGLLDEDVSDMDSVAYFRQQLASEIKRMTEMCDTWDKICEQTVLSDTIQEAVLSAVGQARLLMSQKLQQFSALVDSCAAPQPHQPLVTPADLQGFWDMVFMQVENVNMRFKNLEDLRSRGWVEQQPVEVKKKVIKPITKKITKPVGGGPSRLREMIAAARKAKKEQEEAPISQAEGDKTFEAGFFSVVSPIRSLATHSPAPRTPVSNNSLLKAVLSSEAKKSARRSSASFAMLRASVMAKNMECEGIAPIPQTPLTPVNIQATPGRSILKSTKANEKHSKKSIKIVLFDGSDVTDALNVQELVEEQTDSGISSTDHDKADDNKADNKENKGSSRKNQKLARQDAVDWSPIITRSRRKSTATDEVTPRRSSRKAFQEIEDSVQEKTPRRSTRKSQQAN